MNLLKSFTVNLFFLLQLRLHPGTEDYTGTIGMILACKVLRRQQIHILFSLHEIIYIIVALL